jgi:hypothetical protein
MKLSISAWGTEVAPTLSVPEEKGPAKTSMVETKEARKIKVTILRFIRNLQDKKSL